MNIYLAVQAATQSALHVGTGGSDSATSLVRRRADGALVIPGSSIAGALRAHLTRIIPAMSGLDTLGRKTICDSLASNKSGDKVCGCVVCQLMGDVFPGDRAKASRLIIDDAVLAATNTRIRDGVGIDRLTGSASRETRSKFDLETVPAGIAFTLKMELEEATDLDKQLLALVLDEWQAGRVHLGGRVNRGLGAVAFDWADVSAWELDPEHRLDDLMVLLRDKPFPEPAKVDLRKWHPGRRYHQRFHPVVGSVQSWFEVEFDLQCQGFFLTDDISAAHQMGLGHVSMDGLLPGSSFRGVLRSQAERVARTFANLLSNNEPEFLSRCPASNPLATWNGEGHRPELESGASRLRWSQHPKVTVDIQQRPPRELLDLSERLFGNTLYGSRLRIEDLPLKGEPVFKPLDFLAIDRFTGGGAEGLKFDALALWQPRFLGRLYLEAPEAWELGWLLYTLKDIADGLVPVGFGAAKGFGQVRLENVRWAVGRTYGETLPDLTPWPSDADSYFQTLTFKGWNGLPAVCFEAWSKEWRDMVRGYSVDPRIAHHAQTDYYWRSDGGVWSLYPKEIDLDTLHAK